MLDKDLYDWSFFTAGESALDLLGHLARWGLKAGIEPKKKWKARALTDLQEMNALQAQGIDAANSPGSANTRYWLKARILGDNSPHNFIPDPCDPAYASDLDYVYKLISMHTTFISVEKTIAPVTRGDIISVELNVSNDRYELQYGKYRKLLSIEDPPDNLKAECASLVKLFGKMSHRDLPARASRPHHPSPPPRTLSSKSGPNPYTQDKCSFKTAQASLGLKDGRRGASGPSIPKLSLREWTIVYKSLKPLFDFIGAKEGGYDSCNRGNAGDTPRALCKTMFGKPISQMTVGEIKKLQKDKRVSAVGRAQWIRSTFKSMASLTDTADNVVFSPDIQNAWMAATAMKRRQWLGSYILSMHDYECLAAYEIAFEWASLPLPAPGSWLDGAKYDTPTFQKTYKMDSLPRGVTPYANLSSGNNASHRSAEAVVNAINAARASARTSPELQALFKSKGIALK